MSVLGIFHRFTRFHFVYSAESEFHWEPLCSQTFLARQKFLLFQADLLAMAKKKAMQIPPFPICIQHYSCRHSVEVVEATVGEVSCGTFALMVWYSTVQSKCRAVL